MESKRGCYKHFNFHRYLSLENDTNQIMTKIYNKGETTGVECFIITKKYDTARKS